MRVRKWFSALLTAALLATACAGPAFGQAWQKVFELPDSVIPFTIENYYHQVVTNHPVARQAELLDDMARQELRLARGNFDPKIEVQYLNKNYGGREYYNILNGSVKFPTIFPIDPSVGVDRNKGAYLNPERYISGEENYRQFYSGISLPLGRGLITDDRRAAMRQAELFGDLMEAEQISTINKLLLQAAKDYWEWCFAYYNFQLYNQSVSIAGELFRRARINYELGEAAPIDTIQAMITLQQRQVERQEALIAFLNTGITVSNHLWDSTGQPLQLSPQMAPVFPKDIIAVSPAELEELKNLASANHPDLQKLTVKLQQLDTERRLAAEYLKPKLDVSYYLLNQPFDPEWNANFDWNDNYKLGLDFSFPLFLRKERAKLAQAKIKINSTQYERRLAQRQIVNQIVAAHNELVTNTAIINQQSQMVDNYNRLLDAELLNLENGESDLFKINIQQEKVIQSQSKLLKLLSEYEKQRAFLYWAAGTRRL